MSNPASNGTSVDQALIVDLRKKVSALELRNTELETEKRNLGPELRRYQRVVELLSDEHVYQPKGPQKGPQKKAGKKKTRKLGGHTLNEFREVISAYADDHEEFAQVDIRSMMGGISTSQAALAFEQLRQENFIRFARVEGKRHIYRLTREAVKANG